MFKDTSVPVLEMKDGDVAIITDWAEEDCIGRIVQRFDIDLVTIGRDSSLGWEGAFAAGSAIRSPDCKVRILKPSEWKLMVTTTIEYNF